MQVDLISGADVSGSFDSNAHDNAMPGREADALFHLHVDWRSYRFEAIVKRGKGQVCDLTVTCDLGVMPYSAEGLQRRANIFAILRAVQNGFPIRIDLSDAQKLKLTARTALSNPVTAKSAIAAITTLLVQARPYLDMIKMLQPVPDSVRFGQ
jgi:hypothetical protein